MPRTGPVVVLATLAALAAGLAGCAGTPGTPSTPGTPGNGAGRADPRPAPSGGATSATTTARPAAPTATDLVTGLDVPWDVTFLPSGEALVTLRDRGELLRVAPGGAVTRLGTVPGVAADGEGGLLGVAPSPAYERDHTVFLYLTAADDNRVVRATVDGDRLSATVTPILTGITKAGFHNGGRIAFGPDGYLYVGTGDAGHTDLAQDKRSVNGKILRVTTDGRPAPGNPFGNAVWSLGHRNVQGLAWTADGRMWASEFGQNTWDELNLVEKGRNYGWPVVEGDVEDRRYTRPVAQWPTADASPSGIAVGPDGAIWMAALQGRSLWRIPVADGTAGTPQRLLEGRFGRLRDVAIAPDGRLWVLTSNTFRGTPAPGDDRVLVVTVPTT